MLVHTRVVLYNSVDGRFKVEPYAQLVCFAGYAVCRWPAYKGQMPRLRPGIRRIFLLPRDGHLMGPMGRLEGDMLVTM